MEIPALCSLLILLIFPLLSVSQNSDTVRDQFAFTGFNNSNLNLDGASVTKPTGALKLTNQSSFDIGHAFYPDSFRMLNRNNSTNSTSAYNVSSFSTYFVFAIRPRVPGGGGYGLAFAMAPRKRFPGAQAEHYLGLFNSTTDQNPSNHMLVIEFDTVNGYGGDKDREGNHVGININGMNSVVTEPAAYYVDDGVKEDVKLESGDLIQAWVEFEAESQLVHVTISPIHVAKPSKPLLSARVPKTVFLESMFVGFSASTGINRSFHYVLGWSFGLNGPAPAVNVTRLPPLPSEAIAKSRNSYSQRVVALIAALCALTVFLLGILVFFTTIRRRIRRQRSFEDWELDCPHRFRYKDLRVATKGFRESEKIGAGGFGSVYRGILPTSRCEVAVKKITRKDSIGGMREFVAEVESLGRLRHKNLVNLQGWCKHNDDELLLVYDYVPYGSLYSLLFKRRDGFVLSWDRRFQILKGIAGGLLYLHEEWEQVVIHRDVKSSNVLIDADMNPRLGDFGLARLYDHGQMSYTTRVVGTIGYIAPELARSGKASASSDVFAYGVLLLEVATGRHPVGSGHFILIDWVAEQERTLDAADPKLGPDYVVEEMELVLRLGLLCSHPKPESRPTMRQVVRYLNRDDPLPDLNDLGPAGSRPADDINSKFMEAFFEDSTTSSSSYALSSVGALSTASFGNGR